MGIYLSERIGVVEISPGLPGLDMQNGSKTNEIVLHFFGLHFIHSQIGLRQFSTSFHPCIKMVEPFHLLCLERRQWNSLGYPACTIHVHSVHALIVVTFHRFATLKASISE